jgi:Holliday junction resolvase RusA-like endonuclease
MTIASTARSKMKGDIDNQATSLMDLLVDVWLLPDDNKFIIQELEIKNVWYVRNAPICRVELEPIAHRLWNEDVDHKWKNLKEYKGYVA